MSTDIEKLFKPKRSSAETKSDVTNNVARSILNAETDARERKTQKLRMARLAKEASEAEEAAAQPQPKPKAKRKAKS